MTDTLINFQVKPKKKQFSIGYFSPSLEQQQCGVFVHAFPHCTTTFTKDQLAEDECLLSYQEIRITVQYLGASASFLMARL